MKKTIRRRQLGTGLVENLVAISLLSISLMGATSLFISSFKADASARTYSALVSDVHTIIDTYRQSNFSTLLNQFNTNYTSIVNGQTVTQTQVGASSHANYTITFTAIKTSTTNIPEAVKISIAALQRRGKFSNSNFTFETMIAQTR